jgi:hypothetical protein
VPSDPNDPISDVVDHLSRHDRLKAIATCDAIQASMDKIRTLIFWAQHDLDDWRKELAAMRDAHREKNRD